jgi:uncharacterized membrane protein YidH (DUF202 family)
MSKIRRKHLSLAILFIFLILPIGVLAAAPDTATYNEAVSATVEKAEVQDNTTLYIAIIVIIIMFFSLLLRKMVKK